MKHANVSLFIPHLGCKHQCSFCNQKKISGTQKPPDAEDVRTVCEAFAQKDASRFEYAELAFFGGSFTAIGRDYSERLLNAAAPYVRDGVFKGIRISTRPDCIDEEILAYLSDYGVTAIELGAQSMRGHVLQLNGRGHTPGDVEKAARMIKAAGFSLGLQMMTGLYGADEQDDLYTARALAALEPDTMRIYPTLVLQGTRLETLWRAGDYVPQTLGQAVGLGARLLGLFEEKGIRVIRVGLHAELSLEQALCAGPYHPAMRELCEGALMRMRAREQLFSLPKGAYRLQCAPKAISKLKGHGARPVAYFAQFGYDIHIDINASLNGMELLVLPEDA